MMIILDRDGVINQDSPDYIKSPEEWHAIPGSLEAIARFNQAGHQVVVATNQSGIGRQFYDLATLEAINQKMTNELKKVGGHLDGIYYCPHLPSDHCSCRKPKPGLLQQISQDFSVDLSQNAVLIGDSARDIQAAHNVNCRAILVLTGNGKKTAEQNNFTRPVGVFDSLAQAIIN